MGGSVPGVIPAGAIAATVAEARGVLRSEGSAEQALLERLAASAIRVGEAFTGMLFVTRGVEDMRGVGAEWQVLSQAPVTAIGAVSGLAPGVAPVVLPMADYAVDIDADGCGWIRVLRAGTATRVAVTYSAGLAATWDAVPVPLAQGVAALIAHLFDDRTGTAQPPAAVAALWRPFRRVRLAAERRVERSGA